jgi:Predicted nucleotide-binding protein containing TIR-like domain
MTKPSIFIGSSSEALDFPRAVQEQLSSDAEVTIWNELSFLPGQFTIETLLNSLKRFDFAVFVFSPDDRVTSRGSISNAARDNVVFELGLFMGRLGRERAFVLLQKNANVKLLSDLRGLTVVEYEWPNSDRNELSAVGVACNKIRRAIRDLGIFSGNEKQLAIVADELQELGDKSEKLKNEVKQQESDLQAIRVALRGIVTKWEIDYLRRLMRPEEWKCRWDQDTFSRLKRLDEMGFVLPTMIDGERSFERFRKLFQTEMPVDNRPWFNMKTYWEITEDGKKYVKLYDAT